MHSRFRTDKRAGASTVLPSLALWLPWNANALNRAATQGHLWAYDSLAFAALAFVCMCLCVWVDACRGPLRAVIR